MVSFPVYLFPLLLRAQHFDGHTCRRFAGCIRILTDQGDLISGLLAFERRQRSQIENRQPSLFRTRSDPFDRFDPDASCEPSTWLPGTNEIFASPDEVQRYASIKKLSSVSSASSVVNLSRAFFSTNCRRLAHPISLRRQREGDYGIAGAEYVRSPSSDDHELTSAVAHTVGHWRRSCPSRKAALP